MVRNSSKKPLAMIIIISALFLMSTVFTFSKVFATAHGTVKSKDGKPIEGARIILVSSEDGTKYELTSDNKGGWRKANLPPGAYTIGFIADGYEPQNVSVTLSAIRENEPIDTRLIPIPVSPLSQGDLLYGQQKYEEAISFLTKSFILADSTGNLLQLNNTAKELSDAYAETGNYAEAYRYHVILKEMSDSLNFQENTQKLTQTEMQYRFRKDQQVNELRYEKTELLYTLIGLLLGLLVLGSLIFVSRQRARVKQQELQQKGLELENNLLREELKFKEKTFEDNVKYLLTKNELISKVSERLINEKHLFKKENQQIIDEVILELQSDKDRDVLEEFETRFKQIHSGFYENLNQIAPDLTSSEKKLCAFIKLKMSTKEISSITGHSINSIETSRTRLRKKLKIHDKDVSLQDYLEKV